MPEFDHEILAKDGEVDAPPIEWNIGAPVGRLPLPDGRVVLHNGDIEILPCHLDATEVGYDRAMERDIQIDQIEADFIRRTNDKLRKKISER